MPISSFTLLAPYLTIKERRLLRVMLQRAGLDDYEPSLAESMDEVDSRHVLSVGKAALDMWHEYGLVQVGAHHGSVFRHWHPAIGHLVIMQTLHPGSLMQLTIGGHEAKDAMGRDLANFRRVLGGEVIAGMPAATHFRMTMCGACARPGRKKAGGGGERRAAVMWEERLDGAGLCEDHWRGRSKIVRRDKARGKKPNPSSKAAQLDGQLEMLPGDGSHIIVSKG